MTPTQQRRVRDLFEDALERDFADARAWVDREAANDPEVRQEVLSLLAHHARAGNFLVDSVAERLPDMLDDEVPLMPGTIEPLPGTMRVALFFAATGHVGKAWPRR